MPPQGERWKTSVAAAAIEAADQPLLEPKWLRTAIWFYGVSQFSNSQM